jgi:hypothetical protein
MAPDARIVEKPEKKMEKIGSGTFLDDGKCT